jgi:hypothetical protein
MRRLQLRTRGFPFRTVALVALLGLIWVGCNDISDRVSGPAPQPSKVFDSNDLSAANPRVQEVMAVQNRHTDELLRTPDVVGTGTGVGANGDPVVLILTRRAGVPGMPAAIEGVRTRVDVVGEVEAFRSFKGTYRPVPAGVSVGNDNECAAGTIGCMVLKGATHYMLSNNHVFARVNDASIGERIDQPGRYDGKPICNPTGQVGTLAQFVAISFAPSANNVVDCAIAQLTTADDCSMVSNLYTPSSTVVSPSVGLAVKKVGRTSGLTHGTIAGINVTVNVNYGSPGVARFVNQIYVASTFIRSGDSGSLMVTETSENPVGLCFAGGSSSAFANPIGPVLQQLGVSVCSQ